MTSSRVSDFEKAIRRIEGPYWVPTPKGLAYFANPDDADRQRRWAAERLVAKQERLMMDPPDDGR